MMWARLRAAIPLLMAGVLAGHVLTLGTVAFNQFTGTSEFCGLCHASIVESETFATSNHRMNPFAIHAECGDCHTRPGLYLETWDHVYSGTQSLLFGLFIGPLADPRLQQELGPQMAHDTRDWLVRVDSKPCGRCHGGPSGYPMTGRPGVAREHEKALRQGVPCIGCHYNLVHDAQPVRPEFKLTYALKDDH